MLPAWMAAKTAWATAKRLPWKWIMIGLFIVAVIWHYRSLKSDLKDTKKKLAESQELSEELFRNQQETIGNLEVQNEAVRDLRKRAEDNAKGRNRAAEEYLSIPQDINPENVEEWNAWLDAQSE